MDPLPQALPPKHGRHQDQTRHHLRYHEPNTQRLYALFLHPDIETKADGKCRTISSNRNHCHRRRCPSWKRFCDPQECRRCHSRKGKRRQAPGKSVHAVVPATLDRQPIEQDAERTRSDGDDVSDKQYSPKWTPDQVPDRGRHVDNKELARRQPIRRQTQHQRDGSGHEPQADEVGRKRHTRHDNERIEKTHKNLRKAHEHALPRQPRRPCTVELLPDHVAKPSCWRVRELLVVDAGVVFVDGYFFRGCLHEDPPIVRHGGPLEVRLWEQEEHCQERHAAHKCPNVVEAAPFDAVVGNEGHKGKCKLGEEGVDGEDGRKHEGALVDKR